MVSTLDLSKTTMGIELGSTRIKGIIIDSNNSLIASANFTWENKYEEKNWTYNLNDVWYGLRSVYSQLKRDVEKNYNIPFTTVGAIGVSAMMHGYLPFNIQGEQIAAFRTWRNTTTEEAAEKLTEHMQFNIPQRWSAAHLYQAILNDEEHVKDISFLTTLAGYVHWKLTDQKVLGVGDASGMFPIDSKTGNYNEKMITIFDELIASNGLSWSIEDVFPKVILAGENAGCLTNQGALLLDETGLLKPGIPFCAPEGDAGTGMVATNSITEHTGNVSAGTSIFSMIVLESPLSNFYTEIDIVTTPTGKDVAMVHCNNFSSDINAWTNVFSELLDLLGFKIDNQVLITKLFNESLKADENIGGMVHCNYYAGEPITDTDAGRPLFARMPDSKFNLSNFMKSQIYSALATLKIGMDLLTEKEKVQVDKIIGHGGFFKTKNVGQQAMADALKTPVTVMDTASEGGSWGIAVLAKYLLRKDEFYSLEDFLQDSVFSDTRSETLSPSVEGISSFNKYMEKFEAVLEIEQTAIKQLK